MSTVDTPLVSIIVTTKNSARTLGACLASMQQQTYPQREIIVVDNGSNDATCTIANEAQARLLHAGPERSAQRNVGVQNARGTYVLIIDSDMVLESTIVAEGVACMMDAHLLGLVIPEVSFGIGFRAQCKALERSYYLGVSWMEAARRFRKETFLAIGGYDEANTGTEDFDLPQRMQHHYGKHCIGRIRSKIFHDEGNLSLWRTCQKKFYYAQRLSQYSKKEANKKSFAQQASIIARYALFFRHPQKMVADPIVGIGMLFMKTAEMLSGISGYLIGKIKTIDTIY